MSLRQKIFSAYILVLALGAVLAVSVYTLSARVQERTDGLVEHRVRYLATAERLKLDVSAQERSLYAYFATGNRSRYFSQFSARSNDAAQRMDVLERSYASHPGLRTARRGYGQLQQLARELDEDLTPPDKNWSGARALLDRISTTAIAINGGLDSLLQELRAGVHVTAGDVGTAVQRVQVFVIGLSAAIFVISVFVGFQINAYIRDQRLRRRLAMFPERNPNPVLSLTTDGSIVYANPGATRLLAAMGLPEDDPGALLPDDLVERLEYLRAERSHYQVWSFRSAGRELECGIHYIPDLEVFHAYIADVTDRKQAQEDLVHQAYHDTLTDLPNRRMFEEHIEGQLSDPQRSEHKLLVALFGVDRFNVLVEGLGHSYADDLLIALSNRLRETLNRCRNICRDAVLYRFEGDVFAVLVPSPATADAPIQLGEQVMDALRMPMYVRGREFFVTFSIGIAIYPDDATTGETLLRNADTAMQRARQAGGNSLRFYSPEMNERATEWLSLENHLRHAREYGELELYYQPQVALPHETIIGSEALLRWNHPKRGPIPPAQFIPLAEESGMIVDMGSWILRSACQQLRTWQQAGYNHLVVAVNISARQFHQQDLPSLVESILEETRLDPGCLELEITETVTMYDIEHTIAVLQHLKSMGVHLSIDDFGTGFSSLNYLKEFPIDKLKIDQSFIHSLPNDAKHGAITQAVIALAHNLNLQVVAEGVSTTQQLAYLRRYGCDQAQGYLFSKALPPDEFQQLLHRPGPFSSGQPARGPATRRNAHGDR